jgi:hypothetical protein
MYKLVTKTGHRITFYDLYILSRLITLSNKNIQFVSTYQNTNHSKFFLIPLREKSYLSTDEPVNNLTEKKGK